MRHYNYWLDKENFKGNLRFVSKKETNYGYIVKLMTNYITLFTKYIYINSDGSAKIVTKTERNYCPKYQTTVYHGIDGREIVIDNSTRKELIEYKKQRNENNNSNINPNTN
jgi:hypothetical protein